MTATRPVARRALLPVGPLILLLLLLAVACGGDSTSTTSDTSGAGPIAADPTVALLADTFKPSTMTVRTGTTVTWKWPDGTVGHNVKGDGFESPIQTEGTFEHRFDGPGTYTYICTLHPGMAGTVVAVP